MRYRGGGVGHKVTRTSNELLLREEHAVAEGYELEDEPLVTQEDEWNSTDNEGSELDEETYGFGLESNHWQEDDSDAGGEADDGDAEDELGAEDGEEPGDDIEGEEGYAAL